MDNRSKLEKIIEYRKAKGSTRKPKYATRKLSIGLVSCLLGFTLLISPVESLASETSTEIAESEDAGEKPEEEEDKKEEEKKEEELSGEEQQEETEKAEEVEEEKEEFHFSDEQRKKLVDEKFDDAKINDLESQARIESEKEDFNADKFIDDAINESKAENESEADEETNTEAEKEEAGKVNTEENTVEEKTEEKKTEEAADKKEPGLEIGEENVGNNVQATPEDGEKTEKDPSGTENALTEVDVKITKKGIGNNQFDFDGIFGKGTKQKVKLINESTDEEETREFGSKEELVSFLKKIKMSDVVQNGQTTGNVYIEFEGENVAGKFNFQESGAKPDPKTGKTSFELTLWQIRNTDVEVKTKNKAGEDVANPTTKQTNSKIKSGEKEIDIPSQGEVGVIDEDAEDIPLDKIDEFNKKTPEYNLTNKENGFLVDRKDNKVYKQDGEVKVDPDGLKPSELHLTEKPLVTTEDQKDDDDYVKVGFDSGKADNGYKYGTIEGEQDAQETNVAGCQTHEQALCNSAKTEEISLKGLVYCWT